MVSANRVILAGNLTRDPNLRTIPSGTAVVDMGVAINERYKNKSGEFSETTCFVEVVAWDKQAKACADYLTKGAAVLIDGRLEFNSWATPDGQKRTKLRVRADRVQFLSAGKKNDDETDDVN